MAKLVKCVVVTPEKAVLDVEADFVAVPMYDGELGVLPNRAPLIGRLGCGELRTNTKEGVKRYFVDGGFVQIRNDVVTLLTHRAVPAEELSDEAIRTELEEAMKPGRTPEEQEEQLRRQQRARAQLRLAGKSGAATVTGGE